MQSQLFVVLADCFPSLWPGQDVWEDDVSGEAYLQNCGKSCTIISCQYCILEVEDMVCQPNLLTFQRSKINIVSTVTKEEPDYLLSPYCGHCIVLSKVYLKVALLGLKLYFFRCKVLPLKTTL